VPGSLSPRVCFKLLGGGREGTHAARYRQECKDKALARLLSPESVDPGEVAKKIGVSVTTLQRGREQSRSSGCAAGGVDRHGHDIELLRARHDLYIRAWEADPQALDAVEKKRDAGPHRSSQPRMIQLSFRIAVARMIEATTTLTSAGGEMSPSPHTQGSIRASVFQPCRQKTVRAPLLVMTGRRQIESITDRAQRRTNRTCLKFCSRRNLWRVVARQNVVRIPTVGLWRRSLRVTQSFWHSGPRIW